MTSPGAAGSERQAFEALTQEHLRRLYAFALRLTGEHAAAEDLVQETYVKAYQAFHHFVPDRDARPWFGHQTRSPRWAVLVGSAGLLALLIGVSLWPWGPRFHTSPFMTESVNNHIRYLPPDAPYDLQTPDADMVRRWFQGRLDFMVEPPDLRAEGYQLLGTRLGYFLDRMVAEIGYEGHQHRLSIFMTKGDGIDRLFGERVSRHGQEFFLTTTKGYTAVAWRGRPANIVCSIVADLSRDQLLRLAFTVAGVGS
jgi:anti-sigma factor RsiW